MIFGFAERTLRCGVPITPRLSQKLQQTLGGQEGAEFVNWMHEMDARERDAATHGDLAQLRADIAELRQEMQVGFARLETRFERRFGDLIKWSFVFWVGAVAAIALLLAAIGTYGVLAYDVAERTREIALRMALGATPANVVAMVMRRTILLAASGAAVGLFGALALTGVLTKSLYDVSPNDPATMLVVVLAIVGVALLAGFAPARRASRVPVLTAFLAD